MYNVITAAPQGSVSTALFGIFYQPFKPWKHAEANLIEARRRGFEIVVASDNRNSPEDVAKLESLADLVVPFRSDGHCENGYRVVPYIKSDFAFMLADDETASPNLWEFAANPPMCGRFAVMVVPVLKIDGEWRVHKKHLGSQERLTWVEGWKWNKRTMPNGVVTTFEASADSPAPWVIVDNDLKAVIWHHLLDAPREEREEKARRYTAIDPYGKHETRLFYEDENLAEAFVPVDVALRSQLPRG
jgi:hypothetical protein